MSGKGIIIAIIETGWDDQGAINRIKEKMQNIGEIESLLLLDLRAGLVKLLEMNRF